MPLFLAIGQVSTRKNLCILCWAVEGSSPDDIPNIHRNWYVLAPEDAGGSTP